MAGSKYFTGAYACNRTTAVPAFVKLFTEYVLPHTGHRLTQCFGSKCFQPAGFFQSIGYPGWFAYLVIAGEIVGGLALLLGVYTRWFALLMLPILLGATLQHAGNGRLFSATGGGWEFPAFWTVTLVVQALLGDGAYAVKPSSR